MKIVYCFDSISQMGGRESVLATKATALASVPGNSVWIIHTDRSGLCQYPISGAVQLIDLGIGYFRHEWRNPWNLIRLCFKRILHKKRLSSVLHTISPDIIISVGGFEKKIIPSIRGPWIKLAEIHNLSGYRKHGPSTLLERCLISISEWRDYHCVFSRYDGLIVLTETDKKENWRSFDHVYVMPNSLRFFPPGGATLDKPHVIAIGILAYEKNYPSMIRAFKQVSDQHPEWSLSIFGEGDDLLRIKDTIHKSNQEKHVFLKGATNDVMSIMLNASLLLVTSLYESFSMVIIEAMSCGLPVIAYDCPYGPKSIITDGVDGFLVPAGNEQLLSDKINLLIDSPWLRKQMGNAAREKASHYKADVIAKKWMDLFETLLNK